MTLWIFGDSFSAAEDNKNNFDPWYETVAKHLNHLIQNKSVLGAGFQFILNQWNDSWDQIQKDDYVIVILTSTRKTFFFKDNPQLSMPWMINKQNYNVGWDLLSADQQNAFIKYYDYFHNDNDIALQTKSFLFWIDAKSETLNNKILVIKSFNDFDINQLLFKNTIISTGLSLIEISELEVSKNEWESLLICDNCYDIRTNHLSKHNHDILANCVINGFNTSKLNLTYETFNRI